MKGILLENTYTEKIHQFQDIETLTGKVWDEPKILTDDTVGAIHELPLQFSDV